MFSRAANLGPQAKQIAPVKLIIILFLGLLCLSSICLSQEAMLAPDFTAFDVNGKALSLNDFRGRELILHITSIENPLCVDCEHYLKSQAQELEKLKQKDHSIEIITLNMRKNPYSKDGKSLVQSWWQIDITWPWIEDFDPYPISEKYIDYSTISGGFSNPTLLLIDSSGRIRDVFRVYQLGKGEIDGIRSADSLISDLKSIREGNFAGFKATATSQEATYLGMFFLGIVTSLSPCSIALLIALFSYVMTARRREEYLIKTSSASKEGFMIGVVFTLGMATVFFIVGLFLSDIGFFIRQARFFDLAAGLLMIVLGINIFKPVAEIIEPLKSRLFFVRADIGHSPAHKKGIMESLVHLSMDLFKHSAFIGAFTLGVFFALGWAPCGLSLVFPVFIWLISQEITPLAGGLMLFFFGVGHGVLVIPIATFSRAVGGEIGEKYIFAGRYVTKIFGLAVICIGLIYAARYFSLMLW